MANENFPSSNKRNDTLFSKAELMSRMDNNGKIVRDIAEVLTETNEILLDMPFKESNRVDGMMTTLRSGLPDTYWKQYNRGVPGSKSETVQIVEASGIMAARSEVDVDIAEFNGNKASFLDSENKPFLESMSQKMAREVFFGNANKNKEGFVGLECRYSTLSTDKAESAKNVVDAGGTGTKLASIWIVGWGDKVHGFYPKGSKVGLQAKFKGVQPILDDQGDWFDAYVTEYRWAMGLAVRDWRYCSRICNINVDDLLNGKGIGNPDIRTADSTNLILKLQTALSKIPAGDRRIAIYMNNDVLNGLNILAARMNSNVISVLNDLNHYGQNQAWLSFLGHPLRRCDALPIGEKKVTA